MPIRPNSRGFLGLAATRTASPHVAWLFLVAALLFVVRVFVATHFNLFQDEAIYWMTGQSDPLSFCPHPPGVAVLTRLGTLLLGRTELGVRCFSIFLSTLTLGVAYFLARELCGTAVAFWATLTLAAVPSYLFFGSIMTPDTPQLFFWTLALFFTARALMTGREKWWFAAGATVGVGLYVKYMMILYFPSLALCFALSPAWRSQLKTRGPYL